MNSPQLQHYVPAFHLRHFAHAQPEGLIAKRAREKYAVATTTVTPKGKVTHIDRSKVDKVAAALNIYDMYSSSRGDAEYILSRIESSFAPYLPAIIEGASTGYQIELEPKAHRRLGMYLISLVARQPRNLVNGTTQNLIRDITENPTATAKLDFIDLLALIYDTKYYIVFRDVKILRSATPMAMPIGNPAILDGNTIAVPLSTNLMFIGDYYVQTSMLPTEKVIPVIDVKDYASTLLELTRLTRDDNTYVYNIELTDEIRPTLA